MKVNDIRPDSLLEGQQKAVDHDIAFLAERRDSFVEVDCPACGAPAREPLYEYLGFSHQLCRECGTQYISPRPTPQILAAFYAQSKNYAHWAKYVFPQSAEVRRAKVFAPRAERVARHAQSRGIAGGSLVEVGAGSGIFLEEMRRFGIYDRLIGIEPTPDLADTCREKGFEIVEAAVETVSLAEPVDAIVSFEVIEHLFSAYDFLRWAFEQLKPEGLLYLSCPNIRGFDTLLLGKQSIAVDHEHLNYFHPDSLAHLLKRTGFEAVEVETPGVLDVDLVRRARDAGEVSDETVGPVLAGLLDRNSEEADAELQTFLQRMRLSSNMIAVAQKPR